MLRPRKVSAFQLKQWIFRHEQWLNPTVWGFTGKQINLNYTDLSHQNFQGQNLRKFRLKGAFLHDCSFVSAILDEADLESADLNRGRFEQASLQGTNLNHTQIREANLDGANLAKPNSVAEFGEHVV